jgi:TolA-binding protein
MKFLILFLVLTVGSYAQQTTIKDLEKTNEQLAKTQNAMTKTLDSLQKLQEQKGIEKMTENSAKWITSYQNEQQAKQKKQAMVRIGIGLAGFVVLFIGLRRKSKAKI